MAKQLILSGRVQGVFCRNYCRQYARSMRLNGSATNLPDGDVSVLLDTDDESAVDAYIRSLKANPRGYTFYGQITGVTVSDYAGPLEGDYNF